MPQMTDKGFKRRRRDLYGRAKGSEVAKKGPQEVFRGGPGGPPPGLDPPKGPPTTERRGERDD